MYVCMCIYIYIYTNIYIYTHTHYIYIYFKKRELLPLDVCSDGRLDLDVGRAYPQEAPPGEEGAHRLLDADGGVQLDGHGLRVQPLLEALLHEHLRRDDHTVTPLDLRPRHRVVRRQRQVKVKVKVGLGVGADPEVKVVGVAASEDDLDGVEVLPDGFIGVGFVVVDVESFVHGFCVHFVSLFFLFFFI